MYWYGFAGKKFQIFGERQMFLKSGQNFTGKSVAQVEEPARLKEKMKKLKEEKKELEKTAFTFTLGWKNALGYNFEHARKWNLEIKQNTYI